mmetsp:Transcript_7793/g.23453  ORF Transcript_7793/g.23453 Transcript_7793/m.23453 type:complete len:200 (-) Transcript_7793:933-1532(-)
MHTTHTAKVSARPATWLNVIHARGSAELRRQALSHTCCDMFRVVVCRVEAFSFTRAFISFLHGKSGLTPFVQGSLVVHWVKSLAILSHARDVGPTSSARRNLPTNLCKQRINIYSYGMNVHYSGQSFKLSNMESHSQGTESMKVCSVKQSKQSKQPARPASEAQRAGMDPQQATSRLLHLRSHPCSPNRPAAEFVHSKN